MYCWKCGSQVEDGNTFCTSCGAQVDGNAQNQGTSGVSTTPPTGPSYPAGAPVPPNQGYPQQPRQRSKAPIIASVAIVAVLIGGGAAFALNSGAFNSGNAAKPEIIADPGPEEAADGTTSESSASETEPATTGGTSSPGKPGGSEEQPTTPKNTYDLSDAKTYQQTNLFLSNFSEANWLDGDQPEDIAQVSDESLARFGVMHVGINSTEEWESSNNGFDGWGIPPDNYAGGVNGIRSWRLPAERVNDLSRRYFGRDINFDALAVSKQPGWVVYQDGYVFFGTTNGPTQPEGISLAKSATVQSDGTIRIEFDVYGRYYDARDESLYACTPTELMRRLNEDAPHETGYAVVRQGDYNEYTNGLVLVSYHIEHIY